MQSKYIAPPMSRLQLRDFAKRVRDYAGYSQVSYFPVMEFLEVVLCGPNSPWGYDWEIVEDDPSMTNHADTDPVNKIIRIREDVYRGACYGRGRDRMTIGHEIGHVLLQHDQFRLARVDPSIEIRTFNDPEWQASAFAGELLIPCHLMRGKEINEIMTQCGVSLDAAAFQMKKF